MIVYMSNYPPPKGRLMIQYQLCSLTHSRKHLLSKTLIQVNKMEILKVKIIMSYYFGLKVTKILKTILIILKMPSALSKSYHSLNKYSLF